MEAWEKEFDKVWDYRPAGISGQLFKGEQR